MNKDRDEIDYQEPSVWKPIVLAMAVLCIAFLAIALTGCAPSLQDRAAAACGWPMQANGKPYHWYTIGDPTATDAEVKNAKECVYSYYAQHDGPTGTSNPAVLDSYYNTPASRGYDSGATIYCVGC